MKKILVVDDEPEVRFILTNLLDKSGYVVIEAKDGKECLKIIQTERPDLIILDVMMPGMDGWEVLRNIKSDPGLMEIPVLILTVKDQALDFKISAASRANMHMTKPFRNQRLLENVKGLLGQ